MKNGTESYPAGSMGYLGHFAHPSNLQQGHNTTFREKTAKVFHEFGQGKLHSGSKHGPVVTNQKQAVAIALSEARRATKA